MLRNMWCAASRPYCGNTRWIHDHHMLEWDKDHGPTDYNNGLQLCGTHHRYVHEGGWKIRGNPDQALTFIRSDGKEFTGIAPMTNPKITGEITAMATHSAERAVFERQELQDQREQERKQREAQWQIERQEMLQRQKQNNRYNYPPNVSQSGWGDMAAS